MSMLIGGQQRVSLL